MMEKLYNVYRRLELASALLFVVLLLVAQVVIAEGASPQTTTISIDPSGVARVELHTFIVKGANVIQLPVPPLPGTIIVHVDNTLLPPICVNNTLYVFSPVEGNATIDYVANVTISKGVYSLRTMGDARLIIPPNVVLLSLPNVTRVAYKGKNLILYLTGVNDIRYIVKPPTTSTTATTRYTTTSRVTHTPLQTVTTPATTLATTRKAATTPPPSAKTKPGIPWALLGAVILAAIVLAFLAFMRRGESHASPGSSSGGGSGPGPDSLVSVELSDTDRLVLEKLQEAGGKALQSELQRMTGLPKTTLWRAVRRLEKMGLVKVFKDSQGRNVVELAE